MGGNGSEKIERIGKKKYNKELFRLQLELIKLQEWVKAKGLKVVIVFEGRDAAGKDRPARREDIGRIVFRISQC